MGRSVRYGYDAGGRLTHVADSQGRPESYTYNEKDEMLSVIDSSGIPVLNNEYFVDGSIRRQKLADGRRFEYNFVRRSRNVLLQTVFTDPGGFITLFNFGPAGYTQSLRFLPPH